MSVITWAVFCSVVWIGLFVWIVYLMKTAPLLKEKNDRD
jgi:hypothetical protein